MLTTALSVNGQRLSELPKHQRGIDAAEGEVVAHGVFHLSGAGLADDVIQWRAVRVKIFEIQGILNGTSNYILTEMRKGNNSFDQALKKAQELGYAEADPSSDIEGFDAFYKLNILIHTVTGTNIEWNLIERKGISSITKEQIVIADKLGLRFRHMAYFSNYPNEQPQFWVKPVLIDVNHPFYSIDGVNNPIFFIIRVNIFFTV